MSPRNETPLEVLLLSPGDQELILLCLEIASKQSEIANNDLFRERIAKLIEDIREAGTIPLGVDLLADAVIAQERRNEEREKPDEGKGRAN